MGAGTGATVGKLLGPFGAMRGGVGIASMSGAGITMSAVVVVNAVGDVLDPDTGFVLAGARLDPSSAEPASAVGVLLAQAAGGLPAGSPTPPWPPDRRSPGANTTIGVVVTDAKLTKAQANRLASVAHDGLAWTIRPVHTPLDGDTLFVAGTGTADGPPADMLILSMLAAEVTAAAVVDAIRCAEGLRTEALLAPLRRRPRLTARIGSRFGPSDRPFRLPMDGRPS